MIINDLERGLIERGIENRGNIIKKDFDKQNSSKNIQNGISSSLNKYLILTYKKNQKFMDIYIENFIKGESEVKVIDKSDIIINTLCKIKTNINLLLSFHGRPGELIIGNEEITKETLKVFEKCESKINTIHIEGCNVGMPPNGTEFLLEMGRLFKAKTISAFNYYHATWLVNFNYFKDYDKKDFYDFLPPTEQIKYNKLTGNKSKQNKELLWTDIFIPEKFSEDITFKEFMKKLIGDTKKYGNINQNKEIYAYSRRQAKTYVIRNSEDAEQYYYDTDISKDNESGNRQFFKVVIYPWKKMMGYY